MYKYKKTIIINNRRRRIFSKEKSNTEYILYKKEYITLNAYNKKTGGGSGLVNKIRGIFASSEKEKEVNTNEFAIPIINDDGTFLIDFNAAKESINIYDRNISSKIKEYLIKKQAKFDDDITIWIIKSIIPNSIKVNVKGYKNVSELINEINSEDELMKYGQDNDDNFFKIITIFGNFILNKTGTTYSEFDKTKYLKFNKSKYIDGRNVYDKLVDEKKFYIYYYTTNYNEFGENINEGDYIRINDSCTLKCIKIKVNVECNFTYDILLKYISNKNIETEIYKNGGFKFNEFKSSITIEDYNANFNDDKVNLVYNESVSHDERKLYDKINTNIYLIEDYSTKSNEIDKIIIGNRVVKHNTNFISYKKINGDTYNYVIYKYLGDYISNNDIISYNLLYAIEYIKQFIPANALLYYKYVNKEGQKIYDELFKTDKYIYYAKKFSNKSREILEYTEYKDKESKLFNTGANFKCDNIIRGYPSLCESIIVYKYIGNTPTVVGGQRKYKNLKSKKYLK